MASTSRQEEFLAVIRKSQEAVIAVVTNLAETVRTADLPRPPSVSVPFAGKLPGPEDAVARSYDFAEQLLASQRKFAEELLQAAALAHGHAECVLAAETYKPGQVVPRDGTVGCAPAPRCPRPRQSRYPIRAVLSSSRA